MSEALLRQALEALEYHRAQTRPIDSTDKAINALREHLRPTRIERAAIDTLTGLGYTWHGGELWKPPLGPTQRPIATLCIYPKGLPATHELAWLGPIPRLRAVSYDLFLAAGACGQINDGVACSVVRGPGERKCPDCNPRPTT